jgi:hypothetical protein
MRKLVFLFVSALFSSSVNAQWVSSGGNSYHNGTASIGWNSAQATNTAQLQLNSASTTNNVNTTGKQITFNAPVSNAFQYAGIGFVNTTNIFRYQVPGTTSSHVFYAATSASANQELMRINGDGNVTANLRKASSGEFLVNGEFTNVGSFRVKALNTELSVGLAYNGISGSACNGCYSDHSLTHDVVVALRTNGAVNNSNLLFTNHSYGGSIKFTTKDNSTNPFAQDKKRMEITYDGKVIIGQNSDFLVSGTPSFNGDYKLFVAKGILTPMIKVAVPGTGDWMDKVFNDDYVLKEICELESFIKTHKHLPDVPSASEVVENGLDLGKMDATLLRKIEELTLYIIAQEKRINELSEQVKKPSK